MIVVVDYLKGNLKSVERGLQAVGGEVVVSSDRATIARAHAVVLPGVGAFADAARTMEELGQTDVIREMIAKGVPFLGICLGMHLMFEEGVEGAPLDDDEVSSHNAHGLAVLPGVVTALPSVDMQGNTYKIPHVGWNSIFSTNQEALALCGEKQYFDNPLLAHIKQGEFFYFTHSYQAPFVSATVASTEHSAVFPSVVHYGEVAFGVQFHPEKSSNAGAAVLRNFVSLAEHVRKV